MACSAGGGHSLLTLPHQVFHVTVNIHNVGSVTVVPNLTSFLPALPLSYNRRVVVDLWNIRNLCMLVIDPLTNLTANSSALGKLLLSPQKKVR